MTASTVSAVVSVVLALLKFANFIFGWLHDQKLIQEGQDRQIALEISAMAERSKTIAAVSERFKDMAPAEVIKELEQQGALRD